MNQPELLWIDDPASGLRAAIALDSLVLGPACGGIRTHRYPDKGAVIADAQRLARAMTIKCAVAGLDAGGGKAVVWDHGAWDREAGFERLGQAIEDLGGRFFTAGDLGTTEADLAVLARRTRFVHLDAPGLGAAIARGYAGCAAACLARRGAGFAGLRAAVQGAGFIGAACAGTLAAAGAEVFVADVDGARAEALAAALGGRVLAPDEVLRADVDLIAPCAMGGAIDAAVAAELRAWALCGAANGIVADPAAGEVLAARQIVHVPDVVASAGAVVQGVARDLMGVADPGPLLDRLGAIAAEILAESAERGEPADRVAEERARARLAAAAGGDCLLPPEARRSER